MREVLLDLGGVPDAESLSGLAVVGEHLFLAPDEGAALVRLTRRPDGSYGSARSFPVAELVPVPARPSKDEQKPAEIDLEAVDVENGCLHLLGSHSAKRKKVDKDTPVDKVAKRLRKVTPEPSRRLLARIPLISTTDGLQPVAADAERAAASLPDDDQGLFAALRGDKHLDPFLAIPGKDNGLDAEGLAVVGRRTLIGLRGPVLRGWAVILEVGLRASDEPTALRLAQIDGAAYRKHFVDLGGLGVRDLTRDGADLLILAGPTMVLDAPTAVLRLPGGADPDRDLPEVIPAGTLRTAAHLRDRLDVPAGTDHPEGIAVVDDDGTRRLLVVHDSPSAERTTDGTKVDLVDLL